MDKNDLTLKTFKKIQFTFQKSFCRSDVMMNNKFVFGFEFNIFRFSQQHTWRNTTCTSRLLLEYLEYSSNNKNYIMIQNFENDTCALRPATETMFQKQMMA